MAELHTTGLTWRDLDEQFPKLEHRELHDGVLIVSPAPAGGTNASPGGCFVR